MRAYSTLIRGLVLVLLGVLGFGGLGAQECNDNAGNILAYTDINVTSNTFDNVPAGFSLPYDPNRDTIFLCAGDRFTIDLDETSVVNTDPNPDTDPGIGYQLYTCVPNPSNNGPSEAVIESDLCIFDPDGTGASIFPPVDFAGGNWDRKIENGFEPTPPGYPFTLVIAPATFDGYGPGPNGEPDGFLYEEQLINGTVVVPECNNVRLDQLVTVTYLDVISIENLNTNPGGCSGSFSVIGGTSGFRGTADYNITIRNKATNATVALDRPSNTVRAGDVVNYTVPEDGTYEIFIEDGVSCEALATVTHTACAVTEPTNCGADAGTIGQLTNVNIQSSSLGNVPAGGTVDFSSFDNLNDTVFLCLGDEFTIDFSEGSETFPSSLESAGIAYHVFGCKPTIAGETRDDLLADPCNFDAPFPFQEGLDVLFPAGYFAGNYDYRIEHAEAPYATQTFNGTPDDPQPVVLTFAPITIDSAVRNAGGVIEYEHGNCIDVALESQITIGYLNPIDADLSSGSCSGSFTVTGGKSELSRGGNYTIRITDATDAAVDALEGGATSYRHGDVVNYSFNTEGTYNVSVTDEVSCGFTGQLAVTEVCQEEEEEPTSGSALSVDIATVPVACAGDNDGSLTVTASGGQVPYEVTYVRTSSTPTATDSRDIASDGGRAEFLNLRAGTYNISVQDGTGEAAGRSDTTVTITEGPSFVVGIETIPGENCDANNTVTLVAVVTLGGRRVVNPLSQGFTIDWTTNQSGVVETIGSGVDTIEVQPNRDYRVTAVDVESGCDKSATINPSPPATILVEVSNEDEATCSGSPDGRVDLQVSGGVVGAEGYRFEFSDGAPSQMGQTGNRSDLLPGDYTVEVFDDNNCPGVASFSIGVEKELIADATSTSVLCFGESTGTISVSASTRGGQERTPYTATLEDTTGTPIAGVSPVTDNSPLVFSNLPAGDYVVVLEDSDPAMCETRDTVTITQPEELALAPKPESPICPEDPDGTVTLVATGGTAPYTFQVINDSIESPFDSLATFDTILIDTNFLDSLEASPFYLAIVTDANDCVTDTVRFEINPRPAPRVVNSLFTTISCPGDTDGQLSAIVNPPPGDSISITEFNWYRLENGSRGQIVSIGGRTTPDTLSVGAYLLEVTLDNGCVWPFPGFVTSPGLVQAVADTIISPTCLGDSNGSIVLLTTGGTPNPDGSYNYDWEDLDGPPITTNERTGLSAGPYNVTITDANNCQPAFETSFVLEEPVGIVGELTPEDVSCPSDTSSDGRATILVSLSDGSDTGRGFNFIWSRGATDTIRGGTTTSLSGLARGPISVTVTDGVCPQVFDTIIGSPDEFVFEEINPRDASCNGSEDGAAEILVTGGTPGYTFSYVDRPEVTNRLEDVGAGLYQLLVTDANGCQADTFAFTIDQPDSLILAIDPFLTTPRVTCFGDEDGVLAVQVVSTNNNSFGDSPYSWSPAVAGGNESSASELAPGTYGVTVTDGAGCQDSLSYTIFEPDPIGFVVDTIADPLCFNDPAEITLDTAFGGQGTDLLDYSFTINNDGFLTPFDQVGLGFGDSVVISVFDSVGCFSEQTFQIQQPDEIVIDLPNRLLVELGDSLTQLNPLISPGGRDYRYRWTAPRFEPPVPFLSNDSIRDPFLLTPTQSVEYTLTVTDENGCQAIDDIFVEIDANRNVFIPNVFSPNMDGRNDDFRIYACTGVVSITKVNIFNRWGGLLFERENIPSSCLDGTLLWDGRTPKGREVDPGVYVYTVEVLFIDGVTLLYRGDIAVVR